MTTKPLSLTEKITSFVGGVFLGTFTMLLLLKVSGSFWGAVFGLLLNAVAAGYLLKKTPHPSPQKKVIAYGLITSLIATLVLGMVVWFSLQAAFQGIAA